MILLGTQKMLYNYRRHDKSPRKKAPATKASVTKDPDDKSHKRQKPQTTKASGDKSPKR